MKVQEDYLPKLVNEPDFLMKVKRCSNSVTELKETQLRRLETWLEISAVESVATLRQVIEGKLIQLSHEPCNI